MIKSLRKKFIAISTVCVLVVFAGIFFFLLVFTQIQTNRSVDLIADTIAINNGVFPKFSPSGSGRPCSCCFPTLSPRRPALAPASFPFGWTSRGRLCR